MLNNRTRSLEQAERDSDHAGRESAEEKQQMEPLLNRLNDTREGSRSE